jgi:general secretion pathway protein I
MIPRRASGFTLLEVLVTLAVLAVALGGALALAHRQLLVDAELRDRALARWVASNRLTALQLGIEAVVSGVVHGETEMDGRPLSWAAAQTPSAVASVDRITVTVRSGTASPLAELTGYRLLARQAIP